LNNNMDETTTPEEGTDTNTTPTPTPETTTPEEGTDTNTTPTPETPAQ
jgi:hypothetical protein